MRMRQKEGYGLLLEKNESLLMHVNSELIRLARFAEEEKPEKTSSNVHVFLTKTINWF